MFIDKSGWWELVAASSHRELDTTLQSGCQQSEQRLRESIEGYFIQKFDLAGVFTGANPINPRDGKHILSLFT